MAQDHIWAPLAEGQPTHHREPGQMIYLQDTEAAQFYYIPVSYTHLTLPTKLEV